MHQWLVLMTVLYLHFTDCGCDRLNTGTLMNLFKNRLRDKDNTGVKNVFPLAGAWTSDTPSVNHSQIVSEGFGLCQLMTVELKRVQWVEVHENQDLMKQSQTAFQPAPFFNFSAARTWWRRSNTQFVSKRETLLLLSPLCGHHRLLLFSHVTCGCVVTVLYLRAAVGNRMNVSVFQSSSGALNSPLTAFLVNVYYHIKVCV